MVEGYKDIIKNYFDKRTLIDDNIKSFDSFLANGLQTLVDEIGDIKPTIVPSDVKEFKIKLDKIWVTKPQITEADGSRRDIYPMEARLRQLTYSAPIYLEVSAYVDGVQIENFTTLIGKVPVMIKSKFCHLNNFKREQLIEVGEDPDDCGGYFILNGNERVLVMVEDLASDRFFVEKQKTGPSKYKGKIFSEAGAFRIPHLIEQMKDGVIYLSFTRFNRIPVVAIIKALGLDKDQDITTCISSDKEYDDIFVNLFKCIDMKNQDDALEYLGKQMSITQPRDIKIEKAKEQIDRYLLPHLGITEDVRLAKAYNLCKLVKKFLMVAKDKYPEIDKDHYMNKRIKLAGDLLKDLLRVNLKVLVNDMLYNFQRLVKRGKFHSIKIIIRDKLLTGRIKTAMATGTWPGGRKGVSQNIDRTNFLGSMSHLQRIISLLSSSEENFEARALHPTQWGRLCLIETPEGTPIGLRKNKALLCSITHDEYDEEAVKKHLKEIGLRGIK